MAVVKVAEKSKKILGSSPKKPYFMADNFVLYKDDSVKFLKSLPENSIDMIFARCCS